MKKLILILAIAAMSQATFAFEATSQTLGYTAAEVIASTAITVVTSEAGTFSTSAQRKMAAEKLQAEIQEYNLSGFVSIYLADKIAIVTNIDATLSTDESVDVLLAATDLILANN